MISTKSYSEEDNAVIWLDCEGAANKGDGISVYDSVSAVNELKKKFVMCRTTTVACKVPSKIKDRKPKDKLVRGMYKRYKGRNEGREEEEQEEEQRRKQKEKARKVRYCIVHSLVSLFPEGLWLNHYPRTHTHTPNCRLSSLSHHSQGDIQFYHLRKK